MNECAKCNGWGVDDVTGFACPSCPTVKQSLTVEPVSNPDELAAAMQADADLERIKRERDQAVEALRLFVKLMNDPDYDLGELCEEFCTRAETILASIEGAGHE